MATPWAWDDEPPSAPEPEPIRPVSGETPYRDGPLWCMGPCGHVAYLRTWDEAVYCDRCGTVTYRTRTLPTTNEAA